MDRTAMASLKPSAFPYQSQVTSRWSDNDMYGHLNNAVYFQYFDSTINRFLLERAGTDPLVGAVQNVVAESSCTFLKQAHYPTNFLVGLRVERIGRSSCTYRLALFSQPEGLPPVLHAVGSWVHVFVSAETGVPTPIPENTRLALQEIRHEEIDQQ